MIRRRRYSTNILSGSLEIDLQTKLLAMHGSWVISHIFSCNFYNYLDLGIKPKLRNIPFTSVGLLNEINFLT